MKKIIAILIMVCVFTPAQACISCGVIVVGAVTGAVGYLVGKDHDNNKKNVKCSNCTIYYDKDGNVDHVKVNN